MKMRGSGWLALGVLAACSQDPAAGVVTGSDSASAAPTVQPVLEIGPGTSTKLPHLEDLTAEELLGLERRRSAGEEGLTESELAVLAEYDDVLARIASWAEAPIPDADATKPYLVTRDYELWVEPGAGKERYTVRDRAGKVLAERVGEEHLRTEFSYLHNLLHPEYKQFYDVIDDR